MFTNLIFSFDKHARNNEINVEVKGHVTQLLSHWFKDITYGVLSTLHTNIIRYENGEIEN